MTLRTVIERYHFLARDLSMVAHLAVVIAFRLVCGHNKDGFESEREDEKGTRNWRSGIYRLTRGGGVVGSWRLGYWV